MFPVSSCEHEHGSRSGGACDWFLYFERYLMNFLLDATLGMLVIWAAVKLVSKLVEYKRWSLLIFGEYGVFLWFATRGRCRRTGAELGDQFTRLQLHPWRDSQFIPHQFCWDTFLISFPVYFYSGISKIFTKIKILPVSWCTPLLRQVNPRRRPPGWASVASTCWSWCLRKAWSAWCCWSQDGPKWGPIFPWSCLIDPADGILIKVISCPAAAGGVAKLHC